METPLAHNKICAKWETNTEKKTLVAKKRNATPVIRWTIQLLLPMKKTAHVEKPPGLNWGKSNIRISDYTLVTFSHLSP